MSPQEHASLGNQNILKKIDTLREINIGTYIPLPQLVVVGDQSSGKSSVLESLTGFSFPHAAGLCTRYATQITCSREPVKRVSISIIPRPDADDALKARLQNFRRELPDMSSEVFNHKLAEIFEEANQAMGISTAAGRAAAGLPAFSEDILRIEISGPEQIHLTVIDVPGIFRVATDGVTTESDVVLIRNMVQRYMKDSRTIILAVISCNVDTATQEILKLAAQADPEGARTMGVLTKPDLASERVLQDKVIDLVQGRQMPLKLGYCVVKNRSGDDITSTKEECLAAEKAFFAAPPWVSIAGRCGIESLRKRLGALLYQISKRELPNVKAEIDRQIRQCTEERDAMGPARSDESTQRQFLGGIALRMQEITERALSGHYASDPLFRDSNDFRLITKIIKLNETFSDVFKEKGHYQCFGDGKTGGVKKEAGWAGGEGFSFDIPWDEYEELEDIIDIDDEDCPLPLKGPMTPLIKEEYESSRGPELGTFNGTVLASAFVKVTQNWESLVVSHTSKAIVLVHDFVYSLLGRLCPDESVCDQIWDNLLRDQLCEQYRQAMDHAHFLLDIERSNRPATFNQAFNANLQSKRQERTTSMLRDNAVHLDNEDDSYRKTVGQMYVPLTKLGQLGSDKNGLDQVCEDILDTLESYYEVARKRFVDTICQQVVFYHLLEGPNSPLKILSGQRVLKLTGEELDLIAGEDALSKSQRQEMDRKLENLRKAAKVLRI